jgi:hypothetical protein
MSRKHIDEEIASASRQMTYYKSLGEDKTNFYFDRSRNGDIALMFILEEDKFRELYRNRLVVRSPKYFDSFQSYLINSRPSNMSIVSSIVGGLDKSYLKRFKEVVRELDSPIYEKWSNKMEQATPAESLVYSAREHQVEVSKLLTTMSLSRASAVDVISNVITEHAYELHNELLATDTDVTSIVKGIATLIYRYGEYDLIDYDVRHIVTMHVSIPYGYYFNKDTFVEIASIPGVFKSWLVDTAKKAIAPYAIISKAHT